MKFAAFPVAEAEGLILAHTTTVGDAKFKKGRVLSAEDCDALGEAGFTEVTGARLDDSDVHEDDAAHILAECLKGTGLSLSPAKTGRCNLIADNAGVVLVDREKITRANMVTEDITIATVPPKDGVGNGQIVATVKIIPFAVRDRALQMVLDIIGEKDTPGVSLAGYQPASYAVLSTTLPHIKDSVIDKTEQLTRNRIAAVGGGTTYTVRLGHTAGDVAAGIAQAEAAGATTILIAAASATVDREDEVPSGIVEAGGAIKHFGMPVDPGNLLVLGEVRGKPVLVLPGCARSPKLNGLDWVMQRLAAGLSGRRPAGVLQCGRA